VERRGRVDIERKPHPCSRTSLLSSRRYAVMVDKAMGVPMSPAPQAPGGLDPDHRQLMPTSGPASGRRLRWWTAAPGRRRSTCGLQAPPVVARGHRSGTRADRQRCGPCAAPPRGDAGASAIVLDVESMRGRQVATRDLAQVAAPHPGRARRA